MTDKRGAPQCQSKKVKDVFLFSHTRTASHLLCRLLSDQPKWAQSFYHFKPAFEFARASFGWSSLTGVSHEQRQEFEKILQDGYDNLELLRNAAASEGKALIVKNHTFYVWEPYSLSQSMWGGDAGIPFVLPQGAQAEASPRTNPTFFADEYLKTWNPVFLIRHPALSFESWYRAESGHCHVDITDKSWAFYTSFHYSRQVYDWFVARRGDEPAPIVIDADDVMESNAVVARLCELINMDPQRLRYSWGTMEAPDGCTLRKESYMRDLWRSTSITTGRSSRGLDMAVKYSEWRDMFGIKTADELLRLVKRAMPDYNYLKSKRIILSDATET